MRGVKYEDILSIVDFLYYGEANIYQENLENFLKIAEEIQLNGLTGGAGEQQRCAESDNKSEGTQQKQVKNHTKKQVAIPKVETSLDSYYSGYNSSMEDVSEKAVSVTKQNFSGDFEDLDEKIKLMITRGQTLSKDGTRKNLACTVCGKEDKYNNIKKHIESNHVEGISIPCNFCEKTFRSRDALRQHNSHHHERHLNFV